MIILFKIFIYLFGCLGCIESQLQCMGTSLCCVGFSLWCIDRLVVAHRLSIWGTWAWLLQNTWGLSYLTGDQTCIPCFARRTLNHWTTRKVPYYDNYNNNATECFLRECSCWVAQSCLTLCDPMDCNTPGFLVLHQLPELTQTHVHWVSDAIQPSSVVPFSSCLQSFPVSRSSLMSWLFTSGG